MLANVGNGKLIRFQLSGEPFVAMDCRHHDNFRQRILSGTVDLFAMTMKCVERDFLIYPLKTWRKYDHFYREEIESLCLTFFAQCQECFW